MALMHLALIDGPFVPHNLISAQESPVPLLRFQMAPRLKILMASRCKKGTQIDFSFSQKSWQTNLLQVPQQGPYGEWGPFTGHFVCLSKTSSFVFTSKGALPQDPLDGIPCRSPTTRALLHSFIKVLSIWGPPTPGSPRITMPISYTIIMIRSAGGEFPPEYLDRNLIVKRQCVKHMWLSGNCRASLVVSFSSKTRLARLIHSSLQHSTVVAVFLHILLCLYPSLSLSLNLIPQKLAYYLTFPLGT